MDLRKRTASGKQDSAWALENGKRFLSIPPKLLVESSRHAHPHPELFSGTLPLLITPMRAVGMALLTSQPRQHPPRHEAPVSADYFRNVRNHPDVLATILDSARLTANYDPATGGTGPCDNAEKAKELHNAFLRFIQELDKYFAYISLTSANTRTKNEAVELQHLVELVASEIGDDSDKMKNKVAAVIRSACDFVIGPKQNFVSPVEVSFQMVALPPVSKEEDSSSTMNPSAHVWHCLATLTAAPDVPDDPSIPRPRATTVAINQPERPCDVNIMIQSFSSTTASFRLRSSAIISFASFLEGTMITTAEELEEALNSRPVPLKECPAQC